MQNAIARKLDPPILNPVEIESVLLNRLSSVGQKVYAELLGISESTASRRKGEGHFADVAKELSILGLQVVPPEAVVVSRHYLQSVETLADIGLRAERCRPGPPGSAGMGLNESHRVHREECPRGTASPGLHAGSGSGGGIPGGRYVQADVTGKPKRGNV